MEGANSIKVSKFDKILAKFFNSIDGRHILLIALLYISFIFFGKKFMENRNALQLKRIMITHNVIEVLANLGVFTKVLLDLIENRNHFKITCMFNESHELKDSYAGTYLMMKIFDLFDTVFIVLRKKNHQLTFLHCEHHLIIIIGAYFVGKYFDGGPVYFGGLINVFVHIVMYSYYLFASSYPSSKYLKTIKKRVTQLQIVQFAVGIVILIYFLVAGDCDYSYNMLAIFLLQILAFMYMFLNFYKNSYLKRKKQ